MSEYEHPEHGEMERVETFAGWDAKVDGWRCSVCHIVAPDGDEDEVFDEYDCEQYESVRKGIDL